MPSPATIPIRCACGQTLHAAEEHVGRKVRCRCGRVHAVRRSARRATPDSKRATLYTAPASATHRHRWRSPRGWRARATSALAAAGVQPRPLVTWLSWGYLAGAALAAVVLWVLGEQWWPANIFLFGPRWLLLLPLVVLLPAAVLVRPRMLAPLVVGAAVVLGPVMGLRLAWGSWGDDGAGARGLRVVTLNAAGADGVLSALPTLLADLRPDVLALQECGDALAAAVRETPEMFHHAEQGLCLISRYSIRHAEMMERSSLDAPLEEGFGGSGFVITYVIDAPHGRVSLTNLHLETPRKGFEHLQRLDVRGWRTSTMLREVESRRARAWVNRFGAAGLVVGDFNLPVESSIFREWWGDFRDAFSEAGTGFGMSRYNGWVRVRIDHILLGRGWRAVRAFVGPEVGSDHRPVVADLRWAGR